ncbi:MAG: PilW family protein [Burkholderiaceae bacterium]|nr:PilW family protein [Burkholderiaceae bacterium]
MALLLPPSLPRSSPREQGATLVELLVGMVVGLLTIVAGLGTLMVSRSLTGTVSDASQLQLQASHALRTLGQQLRQTGGWALAPGDEVQAQAALRPLDPRFTSALAGQDPTVRNAVHLRVASPSLNEPTHGASASAALVHAPLVRDCLGENPVQGLRPSAISHFRWENKQLLCAGSATAQPLVSGVTDFQVLYLQQTSDPERRQAAPRFRYASASELATTDWADIIAVEICLELEGQESLETAGSLYTRCDGSTAVRSNRLQRVFRSTYHLRTRHGLSATPLG